MIEDTLDPGGWDAALRSASGPRQAALLVHGMAAGDRDWLLSRLAASQRSALQALLHELKHLDIPADADLVRQAVRGVAASPMLQPQDDELIDRVGRLDVAAVAAVLGTESPSIARRLLSIRRWPWRDGLLQALALLPCDGDEVRPAAALSRLERLLLEALLARAGALAPRANTALPPAGRVTRWLDRVRTFRLRARGRTR